MALAARGRWLIAGAASALLVAGFYAALRIALADGPLFEATRKYQSWISGKRPPSVDEWLGVRDSLRHAAELTPGDPAIWETLGLVHLARPGPVYAELAYEHLRQAVALRPTSGYTWAAMAQAQHRLQRPAEEVERSLLLAIRYGPQEPGVVAAVSRLKEARAQQAGALSDAMPAPAAEPEGKLSP